MSNLIKVVNIGAVTLFASLSAWGYPYNLPLVILAGLNAGMFLFTHERESN
jgi:hypothetical protein